MKICTSLAYCVYSQQICIGIKYTRKQGKNHSVVSFGIVTLAVHL